MPDRRIKRLIISHVVLLIGTSAIAPTQLPPATNVPRILVVSIVSTALCQAALAGFWAALGAAPLLPRLSLALLWTFALEASLAYGSGGELVGFVSAASLFSLLMFLAARMRGIRLEVFDPTRRREFEQNHDWKPRFGIRDLMLITLIVALGFGAAPFLQEQPRRMFGMLAFWSSCFTITAGSTFWGALGGGAPRKRLLIALPLAGILGVVVAIVLGAHEAGTIYIILTMLISVLMLFATLSELRSVGYRLTRGSRTLPPPTQPISFDQAE